MNTIHRIYRNPWVRLLVVDGILIASLLAGWFGFTYTSLFTTSFIVALVLGDIFMEGRINAQRQKRFEETLQTNNDHGVTIMYRKIGDQHFLFTYDDEGRAEALRTLGRFYRDPDMGISEDEAIKLSMAMQRDECCGK